MGAAVVAGLRTVPATAALSAASGGVGPADFAPAC